jgi:hypothetical protein
MPSPLTVQCPSCDASLKLKSREYVGKRVACPKCRKPFVVEEPADEYDDFSALDDFDSFEDHRDDDLDEDEYDRPARSPSRPAARRQPASGGSASDRRGPARAGKSGGKKRKSRRQSSNLPFIIGGAVVGVGVLVGLGFIVAGLLNKQGGGNVQEFSYLPPDTEGLVKIRVADVMNSAWKDQVVDAQQQQTMNMLKSNTGIDFMQIESMSIAVAGLNLNTLGGAAMGGGGMGGGGFPGAMGALMDPNLKLVMILRSRTELPIDRIRRSSRVLSHAGETYYMDRGGIPAAMYLPDDYTIVAGREADVKRVIDQGVTPPPLPQFAFADLNQQVSVAYVPRDRSFLQNLEIPEVPGFPAAKKLGDAAKTIVGVGFTLDYRSDAAVVQVVVQCGSDADAAQMIAALNELIPQGRMLMDAGAMADPNAAQGVAMAKQILDTLELKPNGAAVVARLSVTRETAAGLKALGEMQGF